MLRLTTLLIAGLYLSMAIFGQGNAPKTIATARADTQVVGSTKNAVFTPEMRQKALIAASATFKTPKADALASIGGTDAPNGYISAITPSDNVIVANRSQDRDSVAAADADTVYVTANSVNMRSGPSTSNNVVDQLNSGTTATLIERLDNGWVHIRDNDTGTTGYMSAKFVSPAAPRT